MKSSILLPSIALLLATFPALAFAESVPLGTAADFAVLAGSAVTNTGPSLITNGHVGVSPGTSITGFLPTSVTPPYTYHAGDAVAAQAHLDLITAYNIAAGLPITADLSGQDLGGLTLLPGVYFFSSSAQLTGILTLNNLGDPDAEFIFQIGSTLITAPNSSVLTINPGLTPSCDVIWQVGSSATLDTNTAFQGHILAFASITLNSNASILNGSALARDGAVTLQSNAMTNCLPIPEPTLALTLLSTLPLLRRPRT